MARVSVVIPAHDAEATLAAAVESVLAQSASNIEIIVVDDGSADGTAVVARSYGDAVRCLQTENRGVSRARNTGVEAATGDFVAFLDADDIWEPTKLERQLALLGSRPDAGVSTTGSLRVGSDLEPLEVTEAEDPVDPCEALLLRSMALGAISSPLIRQEVVTQTGGFDPGLSQCADWDYFIRLGLQTKFAIIPDPLVWYRVSPQSMSSDIERLERETFTILDRFFASDAGKAYIGIRSRCYSNHWMILSGSYLHKGQRRSAVRCAVSGVLAYPPSVRRPLDVALRWVLAGRTPSSATGGSA